MRFARFFWISLFALLLDTTTAVGFQNTAFDPSKVPDSLVQLKREGSYYVSLNKYDQAFECFFKLQQYCHELGYPMMGLNIMEYTMETVAYNGNLNLQERLNLLHKLHAEERRVKTLGIYYSYVAISYLGDNQLDSCGFYYKKARHHLQENKQYLQETNLEITLAFDWYIFGNVEQALKHLDYTNHLIETRLIPLGIEVPHNFYILKAAHCYNIKKHKESEKHYVLAIESLEKDPAITPETLYGVYYNLAHLYESLYEFSNAISYYKKCASLSKKIFAKGNHDEDYYLQYIVYPEMFVGTSYLFKGEPEKGTQILTRIAAQVEGMETKSILRHRILIELYNNLIDFYNGQQDVKKAAMLVPKIEALQSHKHHLATYSYKSIAKHYIQKRDARNAKKYVDKALFYIQKDPSINFSFESTDLQNLNISIELIKKNPDKALTYAQQNVRFLAPNFSKEDLFGNPVYTDIADPGQIARVIPSKIKVLEALYAQKHPKVTPELLLETTKLAIQGVEYKNNQFKTKSAQRHWLNQKAIPLFEKAISVALVIYKRTGNRHYLNEAFQLSEQSKSMMLRSVLQDETAETFGGIPDSLIQREQWLTHQIKIVQKQLRDAKLSKDAVRVEYLDSLKFEYQKQNNNLLTHFESDYPKYYELKHNTQKTNIAEVQKALDDRTILIEYFQGKDHIYIFSITRDQAAVRKFKRTEEYDQKVTRFRRQLIDIQGANEDLPGTRQRFCDLSYDLYQMLVKDNLVAGKSRLMFILDGQLGYLPFETLITQPTNNQGGTDFSKMPYLLRDYAIHYNYSALLFLEQVRQRDLAKSCQILGLAPSYRNKKAPKWRNPHERLLRKQFEELPGAFNELEFLKEKFAGTFLHEKQSATEARFKEQAKAYGILHLAVHGIVDHEKPDLSGLALEEDNDQHEDNILYAYEIKQLDLQAQLVVLSACETSNGQYQRGEGVLSVGRGFMYAGVPSLLTTLWKLNDDTSEDIIKSFYQALRDGHDKDEAIRQAKLTYLENNHGVAAHPALWACFVQVGDYTSIKIKPAINWPLYGGIGLLLLSLSILLFFKLKDR